VVNEVQRILLRDLSSIVITALESRHRANQMVYLAMTDHLTGLANRAQFDRTLISEMAHARRAHEQFTVLYMDLDGFKGINDAYGHASGDEVLKVVATRMATQVRTEDLLARLGGDEFAVFMRYNVDNTAKLLAKRIVEVVSAPITLSTGIEVSIGISIGIATRTDDIDSLPTLLALADIALYKDKRKH
jgi:diguanylate cyclase (GGDEF)-like protein